MDGSTFVVSMAEVPVAGGGKRLEGLEAGVVSGEEGLGTLKAEVEGLALSRVSGISPLSTVDDVKGNVAEGACTGDERVVSEKSGVTDLPTDSSLVGTSGVVASVAG